MEECIAIKRDGGLTFAFRLTFDFIINCLRQPKIKKQLIQSHGCVCAEEVADYMTRFIIENWAPALGGLIALNKLEKMIL